MSRLTIDIASILVEEIRKSPLSLSKIAKKSGVSVRCIQKWLYEGSIPTVETAQSVFAVLGKELRVAEKVEEDAEQETKDNL